MAHRIEIGLKAGLKDPRGAGVVARARRYLHLPVRSCRVRDVYKIDAELSRRQLDRVRAAFTDSVLARSAVARLAPPPFDWLVEVGFKPGVTDNVGRTAREVLQDVLGRELAAREDVFTATQYFLKGALDRNQVAQLANELLANGLIQTIRIFDAGEWAPCAPDCAVPVVADAPPPAVRAYDLEGSDDDLMRISREGILSLSLPEMRAIRDYFRREDIRSARAGLGLPAPPTDVEIECLAQTWSEHCKHKIFAARVRYTDEHGAERVIDGLFKTFIKSATTEVAQHIDWLVSVFSDNAGVIRFNDRWNLLYKVETHNSPSALDPYGGAMTGIVGVNRDAIGTGMGGEMLCNTWGYCLGSPFYDGELPQGLMHPRRIRDGVHHGVIDGGNQSGIPWTRGWERFDDRFIGKPLVFCGTLGRLPATVGGGPSERKEVQPGDRIVMVGGRIGKDGIHGATFSSEELRQESPSQAVQIGDPITQRKMYEFLIEARDLGLYRALTDNGAGGLSSSIGEMCRLSGGADVELSAAPLKYSGLSPWEIFVSEAQERMTLAVSPEQVSAFLDLAKRRDVEASDIGAFTGTGALVIRHAENVVGRLDLEFLHDGCPRLELRAQWSPPPAEPVSIPRGSSRNRALESLLGSLNVCSKEERSRHYDGEVKGLSVIKPFVGVRADMPSDATVMRVAHGADDGVALAEGLNPFLSDRDTFAMAAAAVDEAVRRIVSVGGSVDRIAALDNFCWPDPVESAQTPDGPYKMAQLVRANMALREICVAYRVPLISGKDSMKNDSTRGGRKISIPPTLLVSTIGRVADVRKTVTLPFKQAGDSIYLIGITRDELGGSEFHRFHGGNEGGIPMVEPSVALATYRAMNRAAEAGLLRSAHTPTLGGLAAGLALCALGGELGAEVDLSMLPVEGRLGADARLFSETNSRFIVTCEPDRANELKSIFYDVPFGRIGVVTREPVLKIGSAIASPLDKLRRAFKSTLEDEA